MMLRSSVFALVTLCCPILFGQPVVVKNQHLAHTAQVAGTSVDAVVQELDAALKEAGSSVDKAVKINVVLAGERHYGDVSRMLARRFPRLSSKPAFAFVAGGMAAEGSLVAMDAVGVATKVTPRNSRVAVLPKGPRVYISGQSAGGTLEEATKATLEKLKANLAFAGLTLDDVVQVRSFVDPISSAGDVRKLIDGFFGANPPPQAFVEWTSKGRIEIELIATAKPGQGKGAPLQHLWPPDEKPSPVFCRMTRVDSPVTIYLPGLYGKTRDDANAQIREIFAEMKEMLTGTKSDFLHLVKATYFVSTDEASKKLNEIRPEFYDPKHPPAASKAGVASTARVGRSVSLDMIAVPK